MSAKQKTQQIVELLRHRHKEPEWASFVELSHGTGATHGGRLDFYAINMWKSKRYIKVAYEVKVSRSDFAGELEKPRKREFAENVADECYFAVPAGLVRVDEVPEGWGLMELRSNGLRVKKRPLQRKIEQLPMKFVYAIARRVSDPPPEFPAPYWLNAGQELDLEDVRELAGDEVDRIVAVAEQAAVKQFKQSEFNYKRYKRVADIVDARLGYGFTDNTEELDAWFKRQITGETAEFDRKDKWALVHLHSRLGELLDLLGIKH